MPLAAATLVSRVTNSVLMDSAPLATMDSVPLVLMMASEMLKVVPMELAASTLTNSRSALQF